MKQAVSRIVLLALLVGRALARADFDQVPTRVWSVTRGTQAAAAVLAMVPLLAPTAGGQSLSGNARTHPPVVRIQMVGADDFLKACPPGQKIEFVLGAASLNVDPRWLDLYSRVDLAPRFGRNCPSGPVHISSLYFNSAILELARITHDLGRPVFLFIVQDEALAPRTASTLTVPNPPPVRNVSAPYVEDITRTAFRAAGAPSTTARVYRIVYPAAPRESLRVIDISCDGVSGQPAGRSCFTPSFNPYGEGLAVKYEFRQDRLPLNEIGRPTSSGTMMEADGVLLFDVRMRQWIKGLLTHP